MAFRENSNQQLSFNDTLWRLTAREKKALEKSWARTFAEEMSDKTLSRFRKRCYDYEALYNIDLHHDCIKDLSTSIRKLSAGFDQFDFGCQPAGAWRGGTE